MRDCYEYPQRSTKRVPNRHPELSLCLYVRRTRAAMQLLRSVPSAPKTPRLRYRCPDCRDIHDGLPDLCFALPDAIFDLDAESRETRALVSSDLCVLDDTRFFIRCVLEVSVTDHTDLFAYGLWAEVSARDFNRYSVYYNTDAPANVASFEGLFANRLPHTPETLGLTCGITLSNEEGMRPAITVSDATHLLHAEHEEGIGLERALALVGTMRGFVTIID